jgi:hypothetical protein
MTSRPSSKYYRKHAVNLSYFRKISTENKAYWLGFIAADGYVRETCPYSLSIGLKASDLGHLLKFKKEIEYSGPITYTAKTNSYRIIIYSKELVEDLNRLGIRQRKSLTLKSWKGPKKYMRHYWRGVFDGDGCFSICRKKRKNGATYKPWVASIVGSKDMMTSFRRYVKNNSTNKYKRGNLFRYKKVYRVMYSGIQPAKTIAKLLYRKASVYLDRKKKLSEDIVLTKLCPPIIRHYTKKFLSKMYKKNKSWENVAKVLGVSRNGMFKHIRKLKLYFPIIRHYKIEYLNRLHRKYRTWRKVAAYLEVSLVGLYQHIRKNKSAVIQA